MVQIYPVCLEMVRDVRPRTTRSRSRSAASVCEHRCAAQPLQAFPQLTDKGTRGVAVQKPKAVAELPTHCTFV
jgi:hypothetical protein